MSLNTLVRQKGTEAGLTEGVWSLVQQYEGQLVGMTQYVLQETLPGLTHYVENCASDFLISHNLSKVRVCTQQGQFFVSVVSDGVCACVVNSGLAWGATDAVTPCRDKTGLRGW